MNNLPKIIERIDDEEILKLNSNCTYSFIKSEMHEPYEYTLDLLMKDPRYKGKFRILPKRIERITDGEILELNEDGTYSFIISTNKATEKYTFGRLMEDSRSKEKFRIIGGEETK